MKSYVFGVDIGGTTVKIGLFDAEGTKLDSFEIPTRKEDRGTHILPDINETLDDYRKDHGIDKAQILGIGMGVPGPVIADGTVISCANLGWERYPVGKKMEELAGIPVKVGNDANVAALGEQRSGGSKGYDNTVMITLGTGVGCGIIVEGRILTGANGAAGEFGHVCVNRSETEACNCGQKGCLEQYASATGIVRLAGRYLQAHPEEAGRLASVPEITAKDVFDAAKESDPAALAIVDQFADILGRALADMAAILNPEAILIGGGVSKAGRFLLDAVDQAFRRHRLKMTGDTPLLLATLGNDAGIYGAAGMVL